MKERLDGLGLDPVVRDRVLAWMGPEFDEATRAEIRRLVEEGNVKELTDRFYRILEFGTGGLRGVMEAGLNRMNIYTVGMATQGLANYLRQQSAEPSVVIAHDSRNHSERFAEAAALTLCANGVRTYLFRGVRPTPELSFAVRHLGTTAGIVVTASHNPREYNGYKVYWSDGAQIVAPHDRRIVEEVARIVSPSEVRTMSRKEALRRGLLRFVGGEVDRAYLAKVAGLSLSRETVRRMAGRLRVVYTPLHGAGYRLVPQALGLYGFRKVFVVREQGRPDGDFPTAPYPNPEEAEALRLGLAWCERTKADLLLATDPDSDRLGIAARDGRTGRMVLFNGNQLGSVLTYYVLRRLQETSGIPSNGFVVKTIVTTDLAARIAERFGVKVFDVFTGFKHIATVVRDHPELRYLFGFEESYGFMAGDFVRDKDGVSASCLTAEAAAWAMSQGTDLPGLLDRIYEEFGLFQERLKSLTFKGKEGMERIQRIMAAMRTAPMESLAGRRLERVVDYLNRRETLVAEGREAEWRYDLPQADVLAFFFEGGLKVTIRPSGTEPKVKYYFAGRREVGPEGLETAKRELAVWLEGCEREFTERVLSVP